MRHLTLLFFLLAFISPLFGQDKDSKHLFIPFGTGYSYNTVLDEGTSPIRYQGSAIKGDLGFWQVNSKKIERFNGYYSYGILKNNLSNEYSSSQINMMRFDFDYSYLRKLSLFNQSKFIAYAGASWFNKYQLREHNKYSNNAYNYEFMSAIGLAAALQYPLMIKNRKIDLMAGFQLPILAYALRPAFTTGNPEAYLDPEMKRVPGFFKSARFRTYGKYFSLNTNLEAFYHLKNGNLICLGYAWQYYSLDLNNKVKSYFQCVSISMFFNLK